VNEVDCIVIGAGVIGLAAARALARDGHAVVILERERHFGMHTSSRNSEVIHAGIHHPPSSLKALTCVQGREMLYEYCDQRGIACRRCGKFIVATADEQISTLHTIESGARSNGVFDLAWLDRAHARRLEPALSCVAALSSPSSGIIDSHAYMLALLADAEAYGATIAYGAKVRSLRPGAHGIDIFIDSEPLAAVRAQFVINSAGLEAHEVARSIEGFPLQHIPEVRYAKGSYFSLTGSAPFSRLIYPVPEPGGLGIHMTLDMAGRARFGPDVEWVDAVDYGIDAGRAAIFYRAIQGYWPQLPPAGLSPSYAGIRPKLFIEGKASPDFCISGPADHGAAGVVNLFGMESPGLTASLALADRVAAIVGA
jgi:L-2-hydroxyglutarate oxidase LhgO